MKRKRFNSYPVSANFCEGLFITQIDITAHIVYNEMFVKLCQQIKSINNTET